MHSTFSLLYTHQRLLAVLHVIIIIILTAVITSCGGTNLKLKNQHEVDSIVKKINDQRQRVDLPPLLSDPLLTNSAAIKAAALRDDSNYEDDDPLKRIIATGSFARFALVHQHKGSTVSEALKELSNDPLFMGKTGHGGLTHIGFGIAFSSDGVIIAVDMARLVPSIDQRATKNSLKDKIQKRRHLNSADPLEFEVNLEKLAQTLTCDFMLQKDTGDQLISKAQHTFETNNFALGRVTIAFQVANSLDKIIIPERITDPAIAFAGVGITQDNHPKHEPGSIAVAIFMATPQDNHAKDRTISDLPPVKAMPGNKAKSKGNILEQAWTATLTGNHQKASSLFEQMYRQTKNPSFLYECARAHARNNDAEKALQTMRRYAEKAKGADKKKAEDMIAQLKAGKSIFSVSAEAKMSVEAKRFFLIGQNLFGQKEWDGAIDAFKQAYAYAPQAEILYNIGLAHLKTGRVGEALDFFAEYQRLVPEARNVDEAKQLFEIGVALYQAGQYEAASRRFAMAYGQLPIPDLLYNLALCNKAMGKDREALRLLREFLDTGPSSSDKKAAQKLIDELSVKKH